MQNARPEFIVTLIFFLSVEKLTTGSRHYIFKISKPDFKGLCIQIFQILIENSFRRLLKLLKYINTLASRFDLLIPMLFC